MNKFLETILLLILIGSICFGQNINQNVNQNTVVINNLPAIEKEKYIIEYRTVYKDRPQPKRVARKLSSPICLLNYLWVYPEDLGTYVNGPSEIIWQINRQGMYGRNDWRVPSSDELKLMENYAEKCGLGEDIYLSTSHRNGILRLVSTGLSIEEQREQQRAQMERQREQQLQYEREVAYRTAQANAQKAAAHQAEINRQNTILSSQKAFSANGLLWASCNLGATTPKDKGVAYQQISCPNSWRLPTESEFKQLLRQSTQYENYFKHSSGLVIPFGVYAINRNGNVGYILLPNMMVSSGSMPKYVRVVQNKIY